MISLEVATQLVEKTLNKAWKQRHDTVGDNPLIVIKHQEKSYGWVFFYTAKKYWETQDVRYSIAGNGPVIVEKSSGNMHQLGTALGPEYQIAAWEESHGLSAAESGQ